VDLGSLTWTDVAESAPVIVVPIGSCEQHGPHLPLHTDTVIATAIATGFVRRRTDVVLAPAVAIGASGEHQGFPGTLSIGTAALTSTLIELVRSADWAGGVVLVNGHGGNAAALRSALSTLHADGRRPLSWWPQVPDGDLHAGHTETSLMLAVAPEQVRVDAAVSGPTPTIEHLRDRGVRASSPSGVLGDPTRASAEAGTELLERLIGQLAAAVDDWLRRDGI
jgi:creatinine amidohydrolase